MMWIFVGVVLMLVGVIVFFSRSRLEDKFTREQYLKDLTKFVDGQLEAMVDQPNCFKIKFTFENHPFVFEDIEQQGFEKQVYKGYLRVPTASKLFLSFSEKQKTGELRSSMVMASQMGKGASSEGIVYLPEELKDFKATSNDAVLANKLFEDERVKALFLKYRRNDRMGSPSISLKILDGIITLEFLSLGNAQPNLLHLILKVSSIEKYLSDLLILVNRLNQLSLSK